MSDGVDAAVEGVEALELQAMIDGIGPKPERKQLRPRHHAVLPLGQSRNSLLLTNLTFAAYMAVNVRFVAHAGQRASPGVTGG